MDIMTSTGSNGAPRPSLSFAASKRNNAKHHHHRTARLRLRNCFGSSSIGKERTRLASHHHHHHHHHQHHHHHNHQYHHETRNRSCVYEHGKFTGKIYQAVSARLGLPTSSIPVEKLQVLLNDLKFYPSQSQVSEMIKYARHVRRNGGAYVTLGEFCVLAREMQLQNSQKHRPTKCTNNCEVFLGGSCNPTTWRTDVAIPELTKHGITYYNPQVSMWAPELVAQEYNAKQSASLLLFVVDSQTRCVVGMIEVAYLVAMGRCVVLVVCPYKRGQSIMDEPVTNREYVDLVNGQASLLALVKSQGIKVHSNLSSALQCTATMLRNKNVTNGWTVENHFFQKLRKLREAFDYFDKNRLGEIKLHDVLNAYHVLTGNSIDMQALSSYLKINAEDASNLGISFDQFCALFAEFSTDGCENFSSEDWLRDPVQNHQHHTTSAGSGGAVGSSSSSFDVYLGGSSGSKSNWRDSVIPLLKNQGVTYYNPAMREDCVGDDGVFCERNVIDWKQAMDRNKVLFFYVSAEACSLTTMILAAHYIGVGRNIVLCIQQMPSNNVVINNETLSSQAIKDYNRGRVYLSDLAKRKQVPVFENIGSAIECAIERSRSANNSSGGSSSKSS